MISTMLTILYWKFSVNLYIEILGGFIIYYWITSNGIIRHYFLHYDLISWPAFSRGLSSGCCWKGLQTSDMKTFIYLSSDKRFSFQYSCRNIQMNKATIQALKYCRYFQMGGNCSTFLGFFYVCWQDLVSCLSQTESF